MKKWIWNYYSKDNISYNRLRKAIKEVWNAVSNNYFINLFKFIKKRCKVIVKVNDLYTKY